MKHSLKQTPGSGDGPIIYSPEQRGEAEVLFLISFNYLAASGNLSTCSLQIKFNSLELWSSRRCASPTCSQDCLAFVIKGGLSWWKGNFMPKWTEIAPNQQKTTWNDQRGNSLRMSALLLASSWQEIKSLWDLRPWDVRPGFFTQTRGNFKIVLPLTFTSQWGPVTPDGVGLWNICLLSRNKRAAVTSHQLSKD